MALTDTAVRNAKPKDKPYKLYDEKGLYLLVNPNGKKWWRVKYRLAGKEKLLSAGVYPAVSLKKARDDRDELLESLVMGIDPSAKRQAEKLAADDTFEGIAREWFTKFSPKWAKTHASKIIRRLERDLFPWIGSTPVAAVTAPQLLAALRRIEARGAIETAHRALQNASQVLRYAVVTGRAQRDPSGDLRGALPPPIVTHFPAVTEPAEVGELLRKIEGYRGGLVVRSALQLAPRVFVRPGELRTAKWSDIDLDAGQWSFPVSKTKTQHIVPLSTQAVAILRELHGLTGREDYVFPGTRRNGRPMSENTVNAALRGLGIDSSTMTGHGFRAMARTILDEVLGYRPDFIEHQLAHAVKDPNGRAYNRTAHLTERKLMMQSWSDYLDTLREGSTNVVAIRKKKSG